MATPADRRPSRPTNAPRSGSSSADNDSSETSSEVPNSDDDIEMPPFGPPAVPGDVGTLGPYRIVRELGHGGMGAVYAAIDSRLDRQLALKVMLPKHTAKSDAKERFLREARAAAKINHDHVVTVYEADEREGIPYIAMQYLKGYSLNEYLSRKGNPTISQSLRIAREAAAGLAAAHKIGLVHRDIKPGNLWLEAPNGRVKVLDFGLAKPCDAEVDITQNGALVGTPSHMSPEQARGEKVDHRTDLYSLGVVLYRLLTGQMPFPERNTIAMLMALGTQEPKPARDVNPAIPESLANLVHQLLAKKADDRPATADDVVKRLRTISEGLARTTTTAPATMATSSAPSLHLTIATEANPFAHIEDEDSSTDVRPKTPTPATRLPSWVWVAIPLSLLVFVGVALLVWQVAFRRNQDDKKVASVPATTGGNVEPDKNGKTPPIVITRKDEPAPSAPERKAAEYVFSLGGKVRISGSDADLRRTAELPKDRFDVKEVVLSGNMLFSDANLANLKEFKNLTLLHLRQTKVTDAGLTHLIGFPVLANLDLDATKITDAGLAHIKELPNITYLSLNGTLVTDAGLVHVKELPNLLSLGLDGTKITGPGLEHLATLKKLAYLGLNDTKVTDTGLEHLKESSSVAILYLNGTAITDAGLEHLKERKNLSQLFLKQTAITDAGLEHLKGLTNLTMLNLVQTQVTAKGLADFQTARPNCQIEHNGGTIEPKKN